MPPPPPPPAPKAAPPPPAPKGVPAPKAAPPPPPAPKGAPPPPAPKVAAPPPPAPAPKAAAPPPPAPAPAPKAAAPPPPAPAPKVAAQPPPAPAPKAAAPPPPAPAPAPKVAAPPPPAPAPAPKVAAPPPPAPAPAPKVAAPPAPAPAPTVAAPAMVASTPERVGPGGSTPAAFGASVQSKPVDEQPGPQLTVSNAQLLQMLSASNLLVGSPNSKKEVHRDPLSPDEVRRCLEVINSDEHSPYKERMASLLADIDTVNDCSPSSPRRTTERSSHGVSSPGEEFERFLRVDVGLSPHVVKTLKDNDFDMTNICDVTDEDLKEMGITSVGIRRRLASTVKRLRLKPSGADSLRQGMSELSRIAEERDQRHEQVFAAQEQDEEFVRLVAQMVRDAREHDEQLQQQWESLKVAERRKNAGNRDASDRSIDWEIEWRRAREADRDGLRQWEQTVEQLWISTPDVIKRQELLQRNFEPPPSATKRERLLLQRGIGMYPTPTSRLDGYGSKSSALLDSVRQLGGKNTSPESRHLSHLSPGRRVH